VPPQPLTRERILTATEEVLRRHGPAKATVVDVARALGVSHGSVYRHFRTKAELREAVTQRWLEQAHADLHPIAEEDGPAADRLGRWLDALFAAKRRKAGSDPELFATYQVLVGESSGMVAAHIEQMVGQLAGIVRDGVARGEFAAATPAKAPAGPAAPHPEAGRADAGRSVRVARAVWDATSRFHDPVYATQWAEPGIEEAYAAVRALVLAALRSRN
jgi:AcrR family transcriptional regulator